MKEETEVNTFETRKIKLEWIKNPGAETLGNNSKIHNPFK